ncbi:hypothetical protein [Streptomyces sp. NPDC001020]
MKQRSAVGGLALLGPQYPHSYVQDLAVSTAENWSNAQDLWIGLGLDAKGVPSRVIDSKVTE